MEIRRLEKVLRFKKDSQKKFRRYSCKKIRTRITARVCHSTSNVIKAAHLFRFDARKHGSSATETVRIRVYRSL